MLTIVILLSALAGFSLAGVVFLLVFGDQLFDRHRRRKNVKESVRRVSSWCHRIWSDLNDSVSAEEGRRAVDPFARMLLSRLMNEAARINRAIWSTAREARDMPLDTAESAAVRLVPLARELESVTQHITSLDSSVSGLRGRVLTLLDSAEAYRVSLADRIDRLRAQGVCLGRERKIVRRFGNLIIAHRAYIDTGTIDKLYRLSGMLVVLNSIAGQVIAAEAGRPVKWRSYRKDSEPLKEGVDAGRLVRRASGRDIEGIRFMIELITKQTEKLGRLADFLAGAAVASIARNTAFSAARAMQRQAAYTRICIREFIGQ